MSTTAAAIVATGPGPDANHGSRPLMQVVVGSTRPGRVGLPVARWLVERAAAQGEFDVELVDLAAIGLPFLDEPHHPRLQQYTQKHTRAWSTIVSRADAFVFVTPEYNHSYSAVLKNALDFLSVEWMGKPAAIASYGGVSAGLRAATALKTVLSALRITALPDGVSIPFVREHMRHDEFEASDLLDLAAEDMLNALYAYTRMLSDARRCSTRDG